MTEERDIPSTGLKPVLLWWMMIMDVDMNRGEREVDVE
jgi:hypothetical protein